MSTNANSLTTSHWLSKSTKLLEQAGIVTARLDCLVLLGDATGKDRAYLLAHPETLLQGLTLKSLERQLERRAGHEPLAYIRGKSEFYGREFLVDAHTLEPRPETETMIDTVLSLVKTNKINTILDVGTGSGCIAVSVKLELSNLEVFATDVDEHCVKTARENSKRLGADVTFLQGNLLEPFYKLKTINNLLFAVVANLPYVPEKYELNEAAKFEPKSAIFGGKDGLDLYRQLFSQIKVLYIKRYSGVYRTPGFVLTESLPFQHEELTKIAQDAGYKLRKTDDFIQVFEFNQQ